MAFDMSQHLSLPRLLRFTLPSIGMMICMSAYVIADGFFVSNFCGSTALAAVNFAYPVPMIMGTTGFMLGTGGGAIVARTRGEGKDDVACEQFSLFVFAALAFGFASALIACVGLRPLMIALGATGPMLELACSYGLIVCTGIPATVLQYVFQELMVTAGKPRMGFLVTVAAGITNVALDYLFIVHLQVGVTGAAIGTIAGEAVGGLIPLVYFMLPNDTPLRITRPRIRWRWLGEAMVNGSSEMVSNIAASVVTMAYNVQLLQFLGNDGVAAYSVISYVWMAFSGAFIGFVVGVNPLMGYQYGAKNHKEMSSIFRKSLLTVASLGLIMLVVTRLAAQPLAHAFVGYDPHLEELTAHAFEVYSLAFTVVGFNFYASGLFTSLGNGFLSALIAFARLFVFEVGYVFLLPMLLGPDGIWLSALVAHSTALVLSASLVGANGKRYGYL